MNKTLVQIQSLKGEYEDKASELWRVINTKGDYFLICWFNPKTFRIEVKIVDLFMSEVTSLEDIPGLVLCELGKLKDVVYMWFEDDTKPYPERDLNAEECFSKAVNGVEEEIELVVPLSLDPKDY